MMLLTSTASTLLYDLLLPLAVLVSAAATTATAAFAWRFYSAVETHERALFGDDDVDGHEGVLAAVNNNSERSERNRRRSKENRQVLRSNGLVRTVDRPRERRDLDRRPEFRRDRPAGQPPGPDSDDDDG